MPLGDQPEAQAGVTPFWAYPSAWLKAARNVSVRLPRVGAMARLRAVASDSQAKAWTETLGRVQEADRIHAVPRHYAAAG